MENNNLKINGLTYNKSYNETFYSFSDDNKKENAKYKKAIDSIKNFLIKIIPDYGLSDLKIDKNTDTGFETSFEIKVPENISISDLIKYSDEIFNRILEFAELKNIKFILDELTITLTRWKSLFNYEFNTYSY